MAVKGTINTPEDYISAAPEGRREMLRILHEAILRAAPSLEAGICHGMIGYGRGTDWNRIGCAGDGFEIGLASQKQHVSLYICARNGKGFLVEQNAARLGRVSTGKSCIRFRRLENLNLEVAMELVKEAVRSSRRDQVLLDFVFD